MGSSPKGLQMFERTGAEFRQASAWNPSESGKRKSRGVSSTSCLRRDISRAQAQQEVLVYGLGDRKRATKGQQWEQHPIRAVGCTDWRGSTGKHTNLPWHKGNKPQLPCRGSLSKTRDASCSQVNAHPTIRPICSLTTAEFQDAALALGPSQAVQRKASLVHGTGFGVASALHPVGSNAECPQWAFRGWKESPRCTEPNQSKRERGKAAGWRKAIWHPLVWRSEKSSSLLAQRCFSPPHRLPVPAGSVSSAPFNYHPLEQGTKVISASDISSWWACRVPGQPERVGLIRRSYTAQRGFKGHFQSFGDLAWLRVKKCQCQGIRATITRSTTCAGLGIKANLSQGTYWEIKHVAVGQP